MDLDGRIYVGLMFTHYARNDQYTVVDILTTTNLAGEIVKIEVKCEREFLGQTLTSHHPQSTIIRSIS